MSTVDAITPEAEADALKTDDGVVIAKGMIILRRFLRNRTAVAGLVLFVLLLVFSLVGQFFTPWTKNDIDPAFIGEGPSADHFFGTTQAGIDLYALMVEGIRTSILIGLIVGVGSMLVAAVYGCVMAFYGGKVDKVMLFILEALIMMPSLLVVAVVTSGNGGDLKDKLPSWFTLTIVLLVFGWMGAARLIRSISMSLIERDYVKAARYMGVSTWKIVWNHLIPNIGSLLVLEITRGVTLAILSEVAYSFIGIGIKPPDMSLGVLIGQASQQVTSFPWMFWFPLLAMFALTGSMAMMNDGLRDAFDPSSSSVGKVRKSRRNRVKDAEAAA
ncbi:ABC transporter permease [Arthrobacter sp. NPDC090010]|uniref:ABC transporter permease n=1 Tax=Arthrobacter sp. NPDC090010 TaxID=3363942 RepID=UPI0037FFFC50